MKRILEVKSEHIKKGKVEKFDNIDFNILFKHIEVLNGMEESSKS